MQPEEKKTAIGYDGAKFYEVNPVLEEPVDTMAAGDSFLTAFLLYFLEGDDIVTAMKKGMNLLGSLVWLTVRSALVFITIELVLNSCI